MILSEVKKDFFSYVNTMANQKMPNSFINPPHGVIKHLVKFTNDMSGKIIYVYPLESITPRYTQSNFIAVDPPDMFKGQLWMTLAGYWKYEFWEVYYQEEPMELTDENSPANEIDILPPDPTHGIVQGLIAIGKMYAQEIAGEQEVQYQEYTEPDQTNYIYQGQ